MKQQQQQQPKVEAEEGRGRRLPPLLVLAVGGCLYFTLFWYVVWPPVADAWLNTPPALHPAIVSLAWLTALLLWSLPLCCIVFWCAARQRTRLAKAMLVKRQQLLANSMPQSLPIETNLCLVQPDGLRAKAVRSFPSVIIEEEDTSHSEPGSPASLRRDESSTKALYTGSSKRVSLMDSNSGSIGLADRDVEEALKAVSVASSEDDVFHKGTVFVTPRTSFVLAVHEGPDTPHQANPDAIAEQPEPEELLDPAEGQQVPQATDGGARLAEERRVLPRQGSQAQFFVAGGYRKESVTTEAIILVSEDGIEQYTPGQFAVLTSPEL